MLFFRRKKRKELSCCAHALISFYWSCLCSSAKSISESCCCEQTWLSCASATSVCLPLNENLLWLWIPSVTHIPDSPRLGKKASLLCCESSKTCNCGPFVDGKLYKPSMPPLNTSTGMAFVMIFYFDRMPVYTFIRRLGIETWKSE